jgi:hypothetical protein
MKANEFDERFDDGQDMAAALDTARARRPGEEHRRVNVDFPVWMIAELDREATRLGVTRQSLITVGEQTHAGHCQFVAFRFGSGRDHHHDRENILLGCEDGTVTLLWADVQLAKPGQIACVARSERLPPIGRGGFQLLEILQHPGFD